MMENGDSFTGRDQFVAVAGTFGGSQRAAGLYGILTAMAIRAQNAELAGALARLAFHEAHEYCQTMDEKPGNRPDGFSIESPYAFASRPVCGPS